MDTRTPEQRRRIMRAVKGKDTKPEWVVRRLLYSMGYRYRLHGKGLPGHPDIVFAGRRKVIFVHGCFWHGHGCAKGQPPKSRLDYWQPKLEQNASRDRARAQQLQALGWQSFVIWQCELFDLVAASYKLRAFLEGGENSIDMLKMSG